MDDMIDFVGSRPFRCKLDFTHGYHNIRIHPESVKDTTSCCHMGKYNSLGMQQGDCNAPARMMRAMNFLFRNIKNLISCLDDILIANYSDEEHVKTIRAGRKIAKDNKLWFNKNNCQFVTARVQILGNILTHQGLEADTDKIDTIKEFSKPENKRPQHRFLGMANYLRRFCTQLGSVAVPLSELQGATKYCQWTHLHDVSFEDVKALIMTRKVLNAINPDPSRRIYLVCD